MYKFFASISLLSISVLSFSQQWTIYNQVNSQLPQNSVRALTVDDANNKWIGTDNGLAVFDGSIWTVYNESNSGLPSNIVRCIAIDSQNNKWIGTTNGLAKFDGINWTVYQPSNSDIPDNLIKTIDFDSQGDVWVGTTTGIGRFDGVNWYVYSSNDSSYNSQILTSENIPAIDISNEDVVAVGTINGGLIYLTDTSYTLFDSWTTGLPDNTILCISHDSDGNRWMGTPGAGILVHYSNHTSNIWSQFNMWNSFNPSNSINTILIDNEDRMIAGSQDAGVIFYLGGANWTSLDSVNSNLPDNFIYSLALDNEGVLWVGTYQNGLVTLDYSNWVGIETNTPPKQSNVYPNPSNGIFWVDWEGGEALISVYDMFGKEVYQKQHFFSKKGAFDLSHLANGMYLIQIDVNGQRASNRIIISK